jgi:hypothetical protein
MEQTNIKSTALAIMHFSAFIIVEDSHEKHFRNPVVINYAMSYILRILKQNQEDTTLCDHYKEVFWFISNNYRN